MQNLSKNKEDNNVGELEMTLYELRYYFEHELLPRYFFEYTVPFLEEIFEAYTEDTESNQNPLFDIIFEMAQEQEIDFPYNQEQYKAEIVGLNEDEVMIRIRLPEPEETILCSDIYLLFSIEDLSKKRYFTIELLERKKRRNYYCLCEWEEDGSHANYGLVSGNIAKIEEKIIQLFYNQ